MLVSWLTFWSTSFSVFGATDLDRVCKSDVLTFFRSPNLHVCFRVLKPMDEIYSNANNILRCRSAKSEPHYFSCYTLSTADIGNMLSATIGHNSIPQYGIVGNSSSPEVVGSQVAWFCCTHVYNLQETTYCLKDRKFSYQKDISIFHRLMIMHHMWHYFVDVLTILLKVFNG